MADAKKAVKEPISVVSIRITGDCSKKKEHLIIRKTPAVTKVAACNKAETGVGASIASGSQIWRPSCADLPTAPQRRKKEIATRLVVFTKKKEVFVNNIVSYNFIFFVLCQSHAWMT